jgi:hypothetical protein
LSITNAGGVLNDPTIQKNRFSEFLQFQDFTPELFYPASAEKKKLQKQFLLPKNRPTLHNG